MMKEILSDINENMKDTTQTIKIGIDTGKALIKGYSKDDHGNEIKTRFPASIGIADGDVSYDKTSPIYCSLLEKSYYMDAPGLCDIATTEDNEKNGSGMSVGKHNHDQEIVTLGACLTICKVMKHMSLTRANVCIATGMPISEYYRNSDQLKYFVSILPVNEPVKCVYEGVEYTFTVIDFVLCPETISAFICNSKNRDEDMIIVDIGGNNVQYVLYGNGTISNDRSLTYTDKGGVNGFIRRLITLMKQEQLIKSSTLSEVQGWLMNPKSIPYRDNIWRERFNNLVCSEKIRYLNAINAVFDRVNGTYRDEIARGYKICYTGGGAVFLKNEIKSNKNAMIFSGDEFANVMGFYGFL